jgi:hypothetical protein
MDIPGFFILLLALSMVMLLFSLAGIIVLVLDKAPGIHKVFAERQRREGLRHEVYHYRLSNMLRYLRIPMNYYISNLPKDEIRKHIHRCGACPNIDTCDRCLRYGEAFDMHFCPNYDSLMVYKTSLSMY